jgi:argonaute-like protein implicated in RNA metabolism and viral defense
MSESNDRLIEVLVKTVSENSAASKEVTDKMLKLSNSIEHLIIDNKVREKADIVQDKVNEGFKKFIETNQPILNRSSRTQGTFDKAIIPLIVMFIVAVGTALGFMPK